MLLDQTAALHHHLCPRQVLGVRMGMYAAALLNLDLPQTDKRLFTFVETDGCFSDGVAVATGCWLGHRTMRLMDYGKVAATFVDTQTGRAIRVSPNPESRARAAEYLPDVASRWHAQLEAYQTMQVEELLCTMEVSLKVSMKAIISRHGVRVTCERCGEEILNEREKIAGGQVLCATCAGDSYWEVQGVGLFTLPSAVFPITEGAK
jgi:formylmethanofuran dehydrogenase subunit E